jgi:hypothetical protein
VPARPSACHAHQIRLTASRHVWRNLEVLALCLALDRGPVRTAGPISAMDRGHPHPGLDLLHDVVVVLGDRRPGHLPQPVVGQRDTCPSGRICSVRLCELPRPCLVRVPHWARPAGRPGGSPLRRPRPPPSGLPIACATWAMKMRFVLMTPSQAHRRAAEDLRSKTGGSGELGSLG